MRLQDEWDNVIIAKDNKQLLRWTPVCQAELSLPTESMALQGTETQKHTGQRGLPPRRPLAHTIPPSTHTPSKKNKYIKNEIQFKQW